MARNRRSDEICFFGTEQGAKRDRSGCLTEQPL